MGASLPIESFDTKRFTEESGVKSAPTAWVSDVSEIIERIRNASTIFDGIPANTIRKLLAKTRCYEKWVTLIEERKTGIPCFYILIRGSLAVTLEGMNLAELSGFQIFWEAGFVDEARMATVTVKERSYVIQVLKSEVEELPYSAQAAIYSNLAHEVVKKMRGVNYSLAHKLLSMGTDKAKCKTHSGIEALL